MSVNKDTKLDCFFRGWWPEGYDRCIPGLSEVVTLLIEHRQEVSFLDFRQLDHDSWHFAVSFAELHLMKNLCSSAGQSALDKILAKEVPCCDFCGCHFVKRDPCQHRETDAGMISAYTQCAPCVSFAYAAVLETMRQKQEGGATAAIRYQAEHILKPGFVHHTVD